MGSRSRADDARAPDSREKLVAHVLSPAGLSLGVIGGYWRKALEGRASRDRSQDGPSIAENTRNMRLLTCDDDAIFPNERVGGVVLDHRRVARVLAQD